MFLSSVIHEHVHDLFPGMKAEGCYQFRVTRNSNLFVDDEEVDDPVRALDRRPLGAGLPGTGGNGQTVCCAPVSRTDQVRDDGGRLAEFLRSARQAGWRH